MNVKNVYATTAWDDDRDLVSGPVFSSREVAQQYCESVNIGLEPGTPDFYEVEEQSILTEAPAMTVRYQMVLRLIGADKDPYWGPKHARAWLDNNSNHQTFHAMRIVEEADGSPVSSLVTVTSNRRYRTLTGPDSAQVTAVYEKMMRSMCTAISRALSSKQAAAELVEGIDDGHAAWIIYTDQGRLVGDPVVSDSDKDAILAELNS